MADCGCDIEIKNREAEKVLKLLLSINALMFVLEIAFGILSESTALIADSLDMLADESVYGIILYAVGKSTRGKNKCCAFKRPIPSNSWLIGNNGYSAPICILERA